MGELWKWLWGVFRWPIRAGAILVGHTALIGLLIFGFWLVEREIQALWGSEEPILFDSVPLKYLFHALDLITIMGLGYSGFVSAWRELSKQ
jgi:hypothetical protein